MTYADDEQRHRTFVLRCWLELGDDHQSIVWRFELNEIGAKDGRVFASPEQLNQFLLDTFYVGVNK